MLELSKSPEDMTLTNSTMAEKMLMFVNGSAALEASASLCVCVNPREVG